MNIFPESEYSNNRLQGAQGKPSGGPDQPADTPGNPSDDPKVLSFPPPSRIRSQPPEVVDHGGNADPGDKAGSTGNTGPARPARPARPGSNEVSFITRQKLEELHRHIQDPSSPQHVAAVLSYGQKGLSAIPIKPALWNIVKNPATRLEDSTAAMGLLEADTTFDSATPIHLDEIINNRQIVHQIRSLAIDFMLDNYFETSRTLTSSPSHQRFPELLLSLAANSQEDSFVRHSALIAFQRYNLQDINTHLRLLEIVNDTNNIPAMKEMSIKAIKNPDLTNPNILSLLLDILADHLYSEFMDSIGWIAKDRLTNLRGGHINQLIDIMNNSKNPIDQRTTAIIVLGAINRKYDQEFSLLIESGKNPLKSQQSFPIEILSIYPQFFSLAEDTNQDLEIRLAAYEELETTQNLRDDPTRVNQAESRASWLRSNQGRIGLHCGILRRGFENHSQSLFNKPNSSSPTHRLQRQ